jgi:hypothetical protein
MRREQRRTVRARRRVQYWLTQLAEMLEPNEWDGDCLMFWQAAPTWFDDVIFTVHWFLYAALWVVGA